MASQLICWEGLRSSRNSTCLFHHLQQPICRLRLLVRQNTTSSTSAKRCVHPRQRYRQHIDRLFSSTPTRDQTSQSPNSTIDATEVSHFNALASTWWDSHGSSRLLHLMNPLRHQFITQCLSSQSSAPFSQKRDYLDIGCGGGIFAESAARLPTTNSVTAIDPSPEVLKIAESHKKRDPTFLQPGRLSYLNMGIESLPSTRNPVGYDIVTIFEVLEHVSNPSSFLTTVLRHVKPGGWLVLSTIARTWTSWLVTNVMAEDVLGIVPKGTHDWKKYINEKELREWFGKREGWGSPRAMGVIYVPGIGWREIPGGENVGNYFFAIRRDD